MQQVLLNEWIEKCHHFLQKRSWDEETCLYVMWDAVVHTKYLYLELIEKCIEHLRNLRAPNHFLVTFSLGSNPALTMDMILAFPDLYWNFTAISYQMDINDILKHPELKWNWLCISCNPSVTIEVVLSNMGLPWDWKSLSCHRNITMSDIESHMDLPWDWHSSFGNVSSNPNLTMTMIEAHPEQRWDWVKISEVMELTVSLLRTYAEKAWHFDYISLKNPSITLDLLLATPDLPWDFQLLSCNPCLNMDMILALPDKNWNWSSVSQNSSITMSDIESHMDLPWDWGANGVSTNLSIRMDDAEHHVDKSWDLDRFSSSKFNPDKYIDRWCCKYSILGMHDEDYGRGKECLDYKNALDLVFQNEYCTLCISEYI